MLVTCHMTLNCTTTLWCVCDVTLLYVRRIHTCDMTRIYPLALFTRDMNPDFTVTLQYLTCVT